MKAIMTPLHQLVQRRLWPVAILLLAALVAVPMMLAKEEAPAPPPPPAAVHDADDSIVAEPVVALASKDLETRRRRVLGNAKNPFAPDPDAIVREPRAGAAGSVTPAQDSDAQTGSGSGGGTPSTGDVGGGSGTPSAPSAPAPKPKEYALHELTVRFGGGDGVERQSLKRLQPLPSAENPVLIYMGVLKDGKTAVFLVDHGVVPVGDGECRPSPEECETIRLRAGETQFLDVTDETGNVVEQYQLDLIKIHKSTTASASKAKASYAGSKAGQRLVKARVSADGPTAYRWNAETGTLEQRPAELRSIVGPTAARLP